MKQPLQILQLPVLREYLQGEFGLLERVIKFPYDFEHVLDDIVLLCFLVGNDFLPRLPCLNIREGALDLLFNLYKSILPSERGYLTSDGGKIDLPRLHRIFEELAKVEGEILRRRRWELGIAEHAEPCRLTGKTSSEHVPRAPIICSKRPK